MDVTTLDGRGFEQFVAAGTYFLRKYRGALNDLNVFPVPDGDTGSNLYLTARSALSEVVRKRGQPISAVAAAAASGSLFGARGNSGVIFSQMLRGFAHNVRHRAVLDSLDLALAMREAVRTARAALQKPVEGTMISVATAAADAAYNSAQRERDIVRVAADIVRAAAEALERTPEQLPILKEAGVVDSGGAGIVYFLEGILRFLPGATLRATAYPRRAERRTTFTARQAVSANRFCTEFVLDGATVGVHALQDILAECGDSLIVAGGPPVLKVHLHTASPAAVLAVAANHGRVTREKIDDMERQHRTLVVDAPQRPFGVVAVVPGEGFARIARELGADVVLVAAQGQPSVRELVLALNACLPPVVYLLPNHPDAMPAAREAAALADREVIVVDARDVPSGLGVLLQIGAAEAAPDAAQLARAERVASATLFFAAKDARVNGHDVRRGSPLAQIGGLLHAEPTLAAAALRAAQALGAGEGGLVTLYYGGAQKERDAQALRGAIADAFPVAEVEYYYGGQRTSEYVMSRER